MFAVYATHAAPDDPLSALKIGERPEPEVPAGWVRVRISHASLNRHDLFTLRGITAQPDPISFPMILARFSFSGRDLGVPAVLSTHCSDAARWEADSALFVIERRAKVPPPEPSGPRKSRAHARISSYSLKCSEIGGLVGVARSIRTLRRLWTLR